MLHRFGGSWTDEKLDCLKKYLETYRKIFSTNPRGQYYKTWYVDAFAGTGYRIPSHTPEKDSNLTLFSLDERKDADAYLKGSVRIALDIERPFFKYLFIEKNRKHCQELEKLKEEYPPLSKRIDIVEAEANSYLQQWCRDIDWRENRAVVFLDPYGMQVDWNTLMVIANTKAIDLWILFPLGTGISRLLTTQGEPPVPWEQAITRILGTDTWKSKFYPKQTVNTLFGVEERQCKNANFDTIGEFFLERLREIFAGVAPNPLQLRNSKNNPIYLLCFACGNPKAVKPAIDIASYILNKAREGGHGLE